MATNLYKYYRYTQLILESFCKKLTGKFTAVTDPAAAAASLTAAAIDDAGDVGGFFVNGTGTFSGFLDQGGTFTTIKVAGFANTQVLGINANGTDLVGQAFQPSGITIGFVYDIQAKTYTKVCDPKEGKRGVTVVNGINDAGDLVGFYVNPVNGYTIGMLATPAAPSVAHTGATAQSFDAYSLLAPDAGVSSSLHHETPRVNEALNVAVGPHQY